MANAGYSFVEMKNHALILTQPDKIDERAAASLDAVTGALREVLGAVVAIAAYVAPKFKKFGDSGQLATVLNGQPGFAESGLDPETLHLVVNPERNAAKADRARLADAAVHAAALFLDAIEGVGKHFDRRFSWVPYASLLSTSHPDLSGRTFLDPRRKQVPFADRYTSMALQASVSPKELMTGAWNRSPILKMLISIRLHHEAAPVVLPASIETVRDAVVAAVTAERTARLGADSAAPAAA